MASKSKSDGASDKLSENSISACCDWKKMVPTNRILIMTPINDLWATAINRLNWAHV